MADLSLNRATLQSNPTPRRSEPGSSGPGRTSFQPAPAGLSLRDRLDRSTFDAPLARAGLPDLSGGQAPAYRSLSGDADAGLNYYVRRGSGPSAPPSAPEAPAEAGGIGPRTEPTTLHVNGIPLHTNGASQAAIDEAVRALEIHSADPAVAARLRAHNVEVLVIPHDRALTELPELSDLAGVETADGERVWENVRGVGGHPRDGRIYVGIGEENLAGFDSPHVEGEFADGFSLAHHEIAHVVENYGISDEQRTALQNNFDARHELGLPFTDPYGASNADEYFAQAVNAYFRANNGGGDLPPGEQVNDPEWIQANDPVLYDILLSVYGPPPPPPA